MGLFTLSVTDNTTLAGASVSGTSVGTIDVVSNQLPSSPILANLTVSGTFNYDLSTINSAGDLAVADGGTGASTAADARTNLGLASMAVQDAGSVTITGGTIDGAAIGDTTTAAGSFTTLSASGALTLDLSNLTSTGDLAVADGGTGASTAADARTNLDVDQAGTALALAIALG